MPSRRMVTRVTRPDLVVPVVAYRAIGVPPDPAIAAFAAVAALAPARDTPPPAPDPLPLPPVTRGPGPRRPLAPPPGPASRRTAWLVTACLGALVAPAAIVVALFLRAGGSSLPEAALFGSMTSPATGEPVTSTPGLNGSGLPFVDPGLGSRATNGGKPRWQPGYPGLPGFFFPPSATRPAGKHRSHRGPRPAGTGGGHPGQGTAPRPTHSPGGSPGGTPTRKPPTTAPRPAPSSPTATPSPSRPPASTPPASKPPASAPPAPLAAGWPA